MDEKTSEVLPDVLLRCREYEVKHRLKHDLLKQKKGVRED